MNPSEAVGLLLRHLAETTAERDHARAEIVTMRGEIDELRAQTAELAASIAVNQP